jgi:pyruvate dehydrogenase (quinone)
MPYTAYYPKVGEARCVQIDIDPARIGLRYPVEVGLTGDTRETLRALLPLLTRKQNRVFLTHAQDRMSEWWKLMDEQESSKDLPMRPQVFAGAISRHAAKDAIFCGDVGQVTHWSSRHFRLRGTQQYSCSGTLASMANALPYAIGAQCAFPDRQIIAYAGDGALTMLMGEIAMCVKYNLPVKIFVSRNNALGLIRWEQMMFLGHAEYGIELQGIDFVKIAEGCGAKGFRVERPEEADAIVAKALAYPGSAVIEGLVDPFEPVMPGHIHEPQAQNYAKAMRAGQPSEGQIALTMTRDMFDLTAKDRDMLEAAFKSEIPDLRLSGTVKPSFQETPEQAFEIQVKSALERTSGNKTR